ncbi:glycosyltransferase family 4 protein [Brucella sp. NBRC 12950]|uniref:glycosyltransferase family 4 protein n=1 Tax=Brucella sp. NBRC 12950 TaxID=2994518 RepID=UPI002552D014|nr:glycosyltransferase family 4 protein [Brucella sp. NBRC 12950]
MEGSFVVSQLGARMHYAVPRIFESHQKLAHFYTDICALQGWPRMLNKLPGEMLPTAVRRLVGRKPGGIPQEKMTTFPTFGLYSAIKRLAHETGPKSTDNAIWAGKTFGALVAARGFHGAHGLYAFSGEALELLTVARNQGLWTAVEQMIAPRPVVDRLAAEESLLHPGWQSPENDDSSSSEFAARERAEWRIADAVICPSQFVADHVIQAGCEPHKVVVVPYGVDDRFKIPPRQREPGPLRVLTVGAVGLRKGSPYVGAVAQSLAGKMVFRMVGPIDVRPQARETLEQCVELTGPIPRSEMRAQFEWADVFFLPSLCEGSATVCYEALASGIPVICTENTGSVVRHGIDGYIVPIRDVHETILRLQQISDSPAMLAALSIKARERARDFTVERYGERLLVAISNRSNMGLS